MRIDRRRSAFAAAIAAATGLAAPAFAQEGGTGARDGGPISAIEWLDRLPPVTQPAAPTPSSGGTFRPNFGEPSFDGSSFGELQPIEPPVADSVTTPQIDTMTLDEAQTGSVGLLPSSATGLPPTLWQPSQAQVVADALLGLEVADLPAMQSLLYSLLLAEAEPPHDADARAPLLQARIDVLAGMGAVDPALALVERAGPERLPELFSRWFDLSLLAGTETPVCARMTAQPSLAPNLAARIFCEARVGDWSTAALTYETAQALGALAPDEDQLLRRFLDDELDDASAPLPPPADMTPLLFRLSEAIGEPVPTIGLPRGYAVSDLRGLSGWRAQLEAAERLARTGALPENRLLGIYTDRKPAASGGIWDRVAALQTFDSALAANQRQKALAALPAAWRAMRDAELEAPFARIYAERLAAMAPVDGPAHDILFDIVALGPNYRDDLTELGVKDARQRFILSIAAGNPGNGPAPSPLAAAIAEGFAEDAVLPLHIRNMLDQGRMGEAILAAMQLYSRAVDGEWKDISDALATFRAVGLEDTARRGAIELMLLDRAL